MDKPLGVKEPMDEAHRKERFKVLGVPVSYTSFSWLMYPLNYGAGLAYTLLRNQVRGDEQPLPKAAVTAQRYMTWLMATNYLHSLGHLLAGKLVGAPMDELIVTATRQVNHYEGNQGQHSKATHVARAAGGPLANLVVALLAFVAARLFQKKQAQAASGAAEFALFNALFGALSLLPLPSVDGHSILTQLKQE